MGINTDKIRARLNRLKNGGRGDHKPSIFIKLEEGQTEVRIPPVHDGEPFKDFHLHYNVGKEWGFLCPKRNYGNDCPVCEFASALYKEGTENDDESALEMAKSLFARQRFYSPVLVRGKEEDGIKWWSYGKTIYEELLKLALDPEYGDITDPENGTDLTLDYEKATKKGTWPKTSIKPKRSTSPLCADMNDDECEALLDTMPDIMEGLRKKTKTEIQTALDDMLEVGNDEGDVEKVSSETKKYAAKDNSKAKNKTDDKPSNKSKTKSSKSKVDAAFDKLSAN